MASYVSNASKLAVKTPKPTTSAVQKVPTTTSPSLIKQQPVTQQPITQYSTTQQSHPNALPTTSLQQVQQLGQQYGMDSQMLGWIAEKANSNTKMDTITPQKQAVYDAYQSYLKGEITNKASQGVALSDPNAWKNSLYNSSVSQNLNQSYNNLNSTITNRFDTVDSSLGKIDTGLNNYYDQFNTFEQQMYTDHNGQLDILKLLQGLQNPTSTPTSTAPTPPPTSSPGHVYVPGETSNNEGYVQKQVVTNDLFNRYLQQIYQGGF